MRRVSSALFNFTTKRSHSYCPRGLLSTISYDKNIKLCNKSRGSLLFSSQNTLLQTNPSHILDSISPNELQTNDLQLSLRQKEINERSNIEEAFESAKTLEHMLTAFTEMEKVFDESELGMATLKIGLKLDQGGEDPERALSFGSRALDALQNESPKSLSVAMALQLMGSSCYRLKRFNDGLGYLNRANRVLGTLENSMSDEVMPVLHAVQLELANVKTAMGRREDALGNLKRCLELKEMAFDKNSREIGNGNRDLAEALVAILNFKEALPYCLKALEIHKYHFGSNSVEVANDRRLLGVVYTGLEEHEKALEQNEMSRRVLKNWGMSADLMRAEMDAANMQISLGKYDEAIDSLKRVVQHTDKESDDRALIFLYMGKALCNLEKPVDAKRCLEISSRILRKKELVSPQLVSELYMEISLAYENMNEFETAISLLKRVLSMLEKLPQEQHSEGSACARIGWLFLLTGKVSEGIPYLESAAERLKESFGSHHFGVGYVYNNLGAAYMELDRPQSAAQMFDMAKEIMDVALGPHHADSIEAYQNLSKAYSAMGNYGLAIEFQQRAIDAWEGHGVEAQDELKEAQRLLEEIKLKARTSSSEDVQKTDFDESLQPDVPSNHIQPSVQTG